MKDQESNHPQLSVFLSAYACEPNKGSEPGVGWHWAMGLSNRFKLTVLTRSSNRGAIEGVIRQKPKDDPLNSVRFVYHDLSKPFLWAKRKGLLPTMAYYILWQWSVSRRFGKIADQADVVHHLTFCTLLCPGFWNLQKAKYVLGPVGAPQVNRHYFPLFGTKAWMQRLRGWVMERFLYLPSLRRLLHNAAAVVPASSETRELLIRHGIACEEILLDTGSPECSEVVFREQKAKSIRLIYAGQLERRKGLELALKALAQVSVCSDCDWSFSILGSGPDKKRLMDLSKALGIDEKVHFLGSVPKEDVARHLESADAFLFTSVRDTSGGVNLEAMSKGLPIICIAHQGVGDITDDSCAVRIFPSSIEYTTKSLANAITLLAYDVEMRSRMGRFAKKRADSCFNWETKFTVMTSIYQKILR